MNVNFPLLERTKRLTDSGAVIQKESAAIRTAFREEPSGNVRQQTVLKLLYALRKPRVDVDIYSLLEREPISDRSNVSNYLLHIDLQINDSAI